MKKAKLKTHIDDRRIVNAKNGRGSEEEVRSTICQASSEREFTSTGKLNVMKNIQKKIYKIALDLFSLSFPDAARKSWQEKRSD